ncbi:hypothetical protein BC941DRAFT_512872 [Chlamydoabsidia padenii]|nr:hypothetical protein BC941DRAFT_512872 [Chlamydoabsidia padenii]
MIKNELSITLTILKYQVDDCFATYVRLGVVQWALLWRLPDSAVIPIAIQTETSHIYHINRTTTCRIIPLMNQSILCEKAMEVLIGLTNKHLVRDIHCLGVYITKWTVMDMLLWCSLKKPNLFRLASDIHAFGILINGIPTRCPHRRNNGGKAFLQFMCRLSLQEMTADVPMVEASANNAPIGTPVWGMAPLDIR